MLRFLKYFAGRLVILARYALIGRVPDRGRTFTDAFGCQWRIRITVGTVAVVREETGVLLTGLFDNELKPLGDLVSDVVKLVDVLWVVCRDQAERTGITQQRFAEGLWGDSLGEASEALVRATADFFTSPDQRKAIHSLIDKLMEAATVVMGASGKTIAMVDPHQLAQSYSVCATNTPAKPAANQTREPMANCS